MQCVVWFYTPPSIVSNLPTIISIDKEIINNKNKLTPYIEILTDDYHFFAEIKTSVQIIISWYQIYIEPPVINSRISTVMVSGPTLGTVDRGFESS